VANQEEDYSGSTPILFIKLLVIGEKGLGFLMMGRKGVSIVFFFFFLSHVITLILYYVDI
jgi:hypothetical protein